MNKDVISSGHTDAECYAMFYGTKEEVDAKQEDYLRQYHPFGYNTHTVYKRKENGEWVCRMTRWHSCD